MQLLQIDASEVVIRMHFDGVGSGVAEYCGFDEEARAFGSWKAEGMIHFFSSMYIVWYGHVVSVLSYAEMGKNLLRIGLSSARVSSWYSKIELSLS